MSIKRTRNYVPSPIWPGLRSLLAAQKGKEWRETRIGFDAFETISEHMYAVADDWLPSSETPRQLTLRQVCRAPIYREITTMPDVLRDIVDEYLYATNSMATGKRHFKQRFLRRGIALTSNALNHIVRNLNTVMCQMWLAAIQNARHAKRLTVMGKDFKLVVKLAQIFHLF